MVVNDTLNLVLNLLAFTNSDGLVTTGEYQQFTEREYIWDELRAKFHLDAVYFVGNIPVACFKEVDTGGEFEFLDLHRKLWNFNRTPLLFAIMDGDLRIYNCFAAPSETTDGEVSDNGPLIEMVNIASEV